jgi:hypothetical protein
MPVSAAASDAWSAHGVVGRAQVREPAPGQPFQLSGLHAVGVRGPVEVDDIGADAGFGVGDNVGDSVGELARGPLHRRHDRVVHEHVESAP